MSAPWIPAPLAEGLAFERLPLDPYPSGWYAVAFSTELSVGQVKSLTRAGRELVAFRSASGAAAVLEAWCPHLGAHLGHGGKVEGEAIRCPMHHFGFDASGACVLAGKGYGAPLRARAAALAVRERSGVVFAWHGARGEAPGWEPPLLADPALGAPQQRQVVLLTHVQELAENLFDIAHFAGVHGYAAPEVTVSPVAEGPVIRVGSRMARSADFLGRWSRRVVVDVRFEMHGLGIFLVDSTADGGLSSRMAITASPVAPGRSDLRISAWVTKGDATIEAALAWLPRSARIWLMGRLLLGAMMTDVAQDQAILQHKRHLPRPGLGDLDAGIPVLRRWARQFYREPAE